MCDTHGVHINHSHTWAPGPVLPLLEVWFLLPLSFLLCAAPVLIAQYLSCCSVAKQHTAPCSKSLAKKERHTGGQGGQSWGWEKMVSAGVVPLHSTLASLSLQSPPHQQAHGHPHWCGWAGEGCYWFVHLGELLANSPLQTAFVGMSITISIPQANARRWSEALTEG